MDSPPFRRETTWYGGRGLFATQAIPKGTLVHTCPEPYASVIYRVFRKEVCALCFAYAFDARRSTWNIKHTNGVGVWFCSETCRDRWIHDHSTGGLVSAVNSEVDKLAKTMEKRAAGKVTPREVLVPLSDLTQDAIDRAWAAAERTPLATDAKPSAVLDEMELDYVRFVLSALVRRYAGDSDSANSWADVLDLQDNELNYIRARPYALASYLRIYAFIRRVVRAIPALAPYLATCEAVRAILTRDPGNVFGMYEMNKEGDSEMLGWSMYVSASFFNHDCAPNVRKEREGRAMCFYATRDILPGQELCTNYCDLKESVGERQEQLRLHWYFDCACERCKTESDRAG